MSQKQKVPEKKDKKKKPKENEKEEKAKEEEEEDDLNIDELVAEQQVVAEHFQQETGE